MKRREAKALGLTRYFSGKECPSGHTSERFTTSGSCVQCYIERKKHPPLDNEISSKYKYNPETGDVTNSNGVASRCISSHEKSRTSYYRMNIGGKFFLVHRVAWFLYYGEWPKGVIDHIDGNGLNNKLENIRDVPEIDNFRNCRLSTNNKTGVNGVWMQRDRYVAEITVNIRKISLGSYGTLGEAKEARRLAEVKYKFHERHGDDK